jgi:hypothetical protein
MCVSASKPQTMPIRLVDKSVKTPRAATRNLLSGNQETRYSFDSWLLGLLIKTGRQGLVGFVKQPDKPASNFVSSRIAQPFMAGELGSSFPSPARMAEKLFRPYGTGDVAEP